MKYLNYGIKKLHEAYLSLEITPEEVIKASIKKAKNDENNCFEFICEEEALKALSNLKNIDKRSPLWGIPFVIKDNFSTKDIPTCASSNILTGYVPTFSSEVFNRLIQAGAIPIGKTTMDEFGMGGKGMTGHKGKTFNPWDKSQAHIIGGSSCGSAAAVAAGIVPLGIGSDTGDSVRKPAGYANLVGIKPTWSRISRFGLLPFCVSLDHVAYFTRNVEDSEIVLNILAGYDCKDITSSKEEVPDYQNINRAPKKLVVIKEIYETFEDLDVKEAFENLINKLSNQGNEIIYKSLDLDICRALLPTYSIISCAEATSNTANLDGVKYGLRVNGDNYEELVKNTRTKGFSELIKRRLVIGSYSLLKENQKDLYEKAKKCRHLIVRKFNDILKDVDAIIMPSAPHSAPIFIDEDYNPLSNESLVADNYMCFANFGGYPSITLPLGFSNNMPIGVNVTSKPFEELNLFGISENIQEIIGLKDVLADYE